MSSLLKNSGGLRSAGACRAGARRWCAGPAAVVGTVALAALGGAPACTPFDQLTAAPATAEAMSTPTAAVAPEQEARLEEGRASIAAGQYDHALEIFQAILAENPTIAGAYVGIGDVYVIQENWARAEPAYARAVRIDPRSFDAQFGHGLALQMLDRFDEALRAYHHALTIRPESPQANLNIALTYMHLDEPTRALTFAEKAVEADPASGPAHANLGAIYEELGRTVDAIDAYVAALELMDNQPRLMLSLINVLARENRYREAANAAEILTRIDPTAAAFERLGWCRFKLREYDAAVEAYRQSVEIDGEHWPAHNGIAVSALNRWLLSDRRDEPARAEAAEHFRRSLRINPDQPKLVELVLNYKL
jgi:tetratricopeptide (TPR) repeat protein